MLRLWNASDGSCMAIFAGHNHSVEHMVFSSDGKTLWCGARDGTVYYKRMSDIVSTVENSKDPL